MINQKYKININYDVNEIQQFFINVNNKSIKLIAFNICIFDDKFTELKKILNISEDLSLVKSNIGTDKWYAHKYKEFLDALKTNP